MNGMNHIPNVHSVVPLQTHNRHYNHCRGADQKYVKSADHIFVDRIDIQIEVVPVPFRDLSTLQPGESSAAIRERVMAARQLQAERFREVPGVHCNAQMNSKQLRQYCVLDEECQNLMKGAMETLGLSARAYDRVLKVSRTIADLSNSPNIQSEHLAEALTYRSLDRDTWGL